MIGLRRLLTAGLVACFGLSITWGAIAQPRGEPADPGRGQPADANAPQAADADRGQAADQPQAADAGRPQAADPPRAADRSRPAGPVRPQRPVRPNPPGSTIALKTSPLPGAQSGLGELCLHKFNDLNGDGVQNLGEPPIPGIQFEIRDGSGALILSGITNAAGDLCTGPTMAPGLYPIAEILPAGSPWTTNFVNGYAAAMVTAGNLHIGMIPNRANPNGQICIQKYHDVNGNGQWDSGEGNVVMPFEVRDASGALVASGLTSGSEYCTGMILPPGPYMVHELMVTVWVSTDPGGASPVKPVTVVAATTQNLIFGNHIGPVPPPPPDLTIEKFSDGACTGQAPFTNCAFRVRIRNIGNGAFAGPASISDNVLLSGSAITGVSLLSPPPGWSCTGVQPMSCANASVSIPAGGYIDVAFALTITTSPPGENCARLLTPANSAGPACVRIGHTTYDLSVDSNMGLVAPYGSATRQYLIVVNSDQPLAWGTVLTVNGSLSPAGLFSGMTVTTPGWSCSGPWTGFQCVLSTTSGSDRETLVLHTNYSAPGQTITFSANATAFGNGDPNPGNNNRTETGPLY